MPAPKSSAEPLPLFIPRSNATTEANKTGSWRFFRPRYDEKTSPCSATCPVGEDIGRIEMLASRDSAREAWNTIIAENPFPAVCGRVCFHPCELACNRTDLDEPVAIHNLERFIGDLAIAGAWEPIFSPMPSNGKKIAIIGSGPSGLSAAYFLARLGYACDVFESQPEPGGILRWGIPAYRLPPDVLDSEINRILNLDVNIHCGAKFDPRSAAEIQNDYQGLFMGCGLGLSIGLKTNGGEYALDGLDILHSERTGRRVPLQGTVAVIGGGNTAIDVARTIVRLGATPIIVYRRRIADMPAFQPEIAMAVEEGIRIMELASPIDIEKDSKKSTYILTLLKMKVSETEISGRARVIPDDENTITLKADHIVTAIGAEADMGWQMPSIDNTRNMALSHCKLTDGDFPVVFGGDLANRTKSVADAIASGKQAAIALDTIFNKGWSSIKSTLADCRVGPGPAQSMAVYLGDTRRSRNPQIVKYDDINKDYFQPQPRVVPDALSVETRTRSFAEVEATLSVGAASEEFKRCFNCGICNACDYCRLYCPEMAVIADEVDRRIHMDYCKGCGICVTECPRSAMAMEEEDK